MGTARTRGPATPAALPMHIVGDLLARRQFRAMNTDIEITLLDWRRISLLDEAERFFADFEDRFSRFRGDSELCYVNDHAGSPVRVSREMIALLQAALKMHEKTRGLFEPAVLPTLEAAGYDRSFEKMERDGDSALAALPRRMGGIRDIVVDPDARTVMAPAGMRIDLGGIGKGYCVDRVARLLRDAGPCLINAGGDMMGVGGGLDRHGWVIQILDPADGTQEIDRVRLRDRAVATSTTAVRNWRRGGRTLHHIIDPRTGQPAESGICSVSVIARTAARADVYAKTALILGYEAGSEFLAEHGVHGLFVLNNGAIHTTGRWPAGSGR